MGESVSYMCPKCGYGVTTSFGIGFLYFSESKKRMEEVKAGRYGNLLKEFAVSNEDAEIDFDQITLVCDKCGRIKTSMSFTMHTKDKTIPYIHTCSKCRGTMHKIEIDDDLFCPNCKTPLQMFDRIMWD